MIGDSFFNYLYKMYSLKKSSVLQKFVSFFISKNNKIMENTFGNIELVPLQKIQSLPNQTPAHKKQIQAVHFHQRKSLSKHIKNIDFQTLKRKSEYLGQIQQLKKNIIQKKQKNRKINNEISQISAQFAYVLFEPKHYMGSIETNCSQQQIKIFQQKLLSELDKLYEQNCFLQKQLNKAKFNQNNDEKNKQHHLNAKIDNYSFLRNVWHKKNKQQQIQNTAYHENSNSRSQDIIERLNQKVALLRSNINFMAKQQQSNQIKNYQKIEQNFIISSNKYQNLLKSYEQKCMQLEEQHQRILQLSQQLSKYKQIQKQFDIPSLHQYFLNNQLPKQITQELKNSGQSTQTKQQRVNENLVQEESVSPASLLNQISIPLRIKSNKKQNIPQINSQIQLKLRIKSNNSHSHYPQNNKHVKPHIKTQRQSLIRKAQKLNQSLNICRTMRRNNSQQKQNQYDTTSTLNNQNKKRYDKKVNSYQNQSNREQFIALTSSINFQMDNSNKQKFVRTSHRPRKQAVR